jgi:hypothetical protein
MLDRQQACLAGKSGRRGSRLAKTAMLTIAALAAVASCASNDTQGQAIDQGDCRRLIDEYTLGDLWRRSPPQFERLAYAVAQCQSHVERP